MWTIERTPEALTADAEGDPAPPDALRFKLAETYAAGAVNRVTPRSEPPPPPEREREGAGGAGGTVWPVDTPPRRVAPIRDIAELHAPGERAGGATVNGALAVGTLEVGCVLTMPFAACERRACLRPLLADI